MPTSPTAAFRLGEISDPTRMYAADMFTISSNICGNGGVSVPLGLGAASGMPVSAQLQGAPFDDRRLLRIARALERGVDAGAGLGRGSGAATAIADAVAKKNDELYKTALQEYNAERDFDYRTWDDYTRNMMDQLAQKRQATETKIAMQGDLAKDYYNVMDAAQADRMKAQQDRMEAQQQYDIAMTGLY
jgi:hypothetical protein